jgi:hypothetical protein
MRFTGPFKAYALDLNGQMTATPRIDKFAKKCFFRWNSRIPKFFENMEEIIKIVENIESNGLKRKLDGASQ